MSISLVEWLQENDFEPKETPSGDLMAESKNVRIVFDDTDVVLYVFDDESLSIEEWDARFRNTPASIIIAVIEAAFKTP